MCNCFVNAIYSGVIGNNSISSSSSKCHCEVSFNQPFRGKISQTNFHLIPDVPFIEVAIVLQTSCSVESSVTRLGDFLEFLVTIFHTKLGQIYLDFLSYFLKMVTI